MSIQENYKYISEQFSPILHLHPDEKFFPCSIEWFLSHSNLNENSGKRLKTVPDVQIMDLVQNNRSDVYLDIQENAFSGEPYFQLNSVPVYVTVFDHSENTWRILYNTFYAYNGPYSVCGKDEGEHKYDLEHLSIYVDKATLNVEKIYLGAHGEQNGQYLNYSDINWTGNHPNLYVAKGGHGIYSQPKTYFRIFCCANDRCSEGGLIWTPPVVMIDENTPFNSWLGSWEELNSGDPPLRHWYWQTENQYSSNVFSRLLCPCITNPITCCNVNGKKYVCCPCNLIDCVEEKINIE
jgi:hypothetical protein